MDADLIMEAKHNPERFDALYKKYEGKIYIYFWHRTGHNADISEDLKQETFMRALKHLPQFEFKGYSYLSYLLAIAHNLLVNYYRKPYDVSLDSMEDPDAILVGADDTEDLARIEEVEKAIQALPEDERNILLMKYKKGLKIKDIAETLGKSENAVKISLSRIRSTLRGTLTWIKKVTRRKS